MVRPAENREKETLKNFPQENWNPDEKERAMFVYNSSYNQKPKLRESEFFKKQKKKIKKLGLKFLSPVIVPKLRSESRVWSYKWFPRIWQRTSQNLIRKEQNWAEIVLEIEI